MLFTRRTALVAFVAMLLAQHAFAETYPTRPIRIIHPFGAGAASDVLARVLAEKLSSRIGTHVYIENRPGALGVPSATALKHATPDGYTVGILAGIHTVGVTMLAPNAPYDPRSDYEPIVRFFRFPNILVTADRSIRSMQDLVRALREHPGKLAIGTMPVGTPDYVTAHLLSAMYPKSFVIVPYLNTSDMVTGVVRGDIAVGIQNFTVFGPAIGEKKVWPLAVTTGERFSLLPETPTLKELGIDIENRSWGGIYAPKGTPMSVIEMLNREIVAVMKDPAFLEKARNFGIEAWPSSPHELAATMESEVRIQADVLKSAPK